MTGLILLDRGKSQGKANDRGKGNEHQGCMVDLLNDR